MKTKAEVIEQMRTLADRAYSESKRVGGVNAVALLLEWNAWKRAASMVAEMQDDEPAHSEQKATK